MQIEILKQIHQRYSHENKILPTETPREGIVRAKSEVLITFTGTDSDYYNLLEDHSGGVKTRVC